MARRAAVTLRRISSPARETPVVVDRLHAVDVQVAEDEPLAAAPAAIDLAFERGKSRLSVEHARQLVAGEPVGVSGELQGACRRKGATAAGSGGREAGGDPGSGTRRARG